MSDKLFDIISKKFNEAVKFSDECKCIYITDYTKWDKIAAYIIQNNNEINSKKKNMLWWRLINL